QNPIAAGKTVPSARTGIGPPAARAARGGARRPTVRAVSVRHARRVNAVGARSRIGERAGAEIAHYAVRKGEAAANAPHLLLARPGSKPGNVHAGNRALSKVRNGRALDSARVKAVIGLSGRIVALSAAAKTLKGPARIGLLTDNAGQARATAAPKGRSPSGSPSGGIKTVIQQAVHRGATVKAANDAPPGTKVPVNARSVPIGLPTRSAEQARATAGPKSPSPSGSPFGGIKRVRQAGHHGAAVKAGNDAPPGAKVPENARSVPRGVLSNGLEQTRGRARPGNRGHSRSAALQGRGANSRRAQKAADSAPPGAGENAHSVPREVRLNGLEKARVRARAGNR